MRRATILAPLKVLGNWPRSSQHQARRNALVACTALAERRRERMEVEEFLASYLAAEERDGAAHSA